MTLPLGTLYNSTKWAVEGISEALQFELEEIGVKVKVVEPGAVKTEFMGSFKMFNDESLSDYQFLIGRSMGLISSMMESGSAPAGNAEVIYNAATDGTEQLRYPSTPDAVEWMKNRNEQDDATFLGGLRAMFAAPAANE